MNSENLDDQMNLECPACGGIEFDFEETMPESDRLLQCVKCRKETTYDALVLANADGVEQHVQAIGEDFAKDLTKNLSDAIKKLGFGN